MQLDQVCDQEDDPAGRVDNEEEDEAEERDKDHGVKKGAPKVERTEPELGPQDPTEDEEPVHNQGAEPELGPPDPAENEPVHDQGG